MTVSDEDVSLVKRPDDEVDGYVFDGEIIDDEPPPRSRLRATAELLRVRPVITSLGSSSAGAAVVRGARATARAGWVAGQGVVSGARRAHKAATHGQHREQVRRAQLAGDAEAFGAASDRLAKARESRHKRLLELPKLLLGLLLVGVGVLALVAVLLFVGAVVVQLSPEGATWATWWAGVGSVLAGVGAVLHGLVLVALLAAIPLAAVLAWREGRRASDPPLWLLAPTARALLDAEITPSKVVVALRDLGLAQLRTAIKEMDDGGASMLGPIAIAGCGVQVDVRLPSGTEPGEVRARRPKLSSNLTRHRHEVHVTLPPAAQSVRIWIANPGALDQPIGPSPLVLDEAPRANWRSGKAPWGDDLRGDPAALSLYQRHVLVTGLSNQGKTAAIRALALWLAFDVKPRFRIGDLKGRGDWAMFGDIADVLIEGPTDEHVAAVVEMVEAAVVEMERRLVEGGTWDPLIVIVDEAQVAFMCPAVDEQKRPYGGTKATSRYFMAARKIHNQGRAVDVVLWQGTQDPTDQNLPKLVREGAHIRASLVVGTESQAKMALGENAVNGGAAPHELRQGLDKGTLVVTGDGVDLPPGEPSITIRTHFIDGDPDARTGPAWDIAARAAERRRRAGRAPEAPVGPQQRDHLADILEALRGEARVRTPVVLARLIEIDETAYTSWNFPRLKAVLGEAGAPVGKSDGQSVVRLDAVQRVLGERPVELP